MPGLAPPVADERSGLVAFLDQQRRLLRAAAHGLTEDQARTAAAASELTIGGLIKHAARCERGWTDLVLQRERTQPDAEDDEFVLGPDETLAGALADYRAATAETDAVLAGIADLGRPVPVPPGQVWISADVTEWSVRWVLLHLIEETARHGGHADIIRETIDGATLYPLMAAAESWPDPWFEPWRPAEEQAAEG
ncbi:DinB family protein [Kitasatospora sp. NPDC048365]|uniref:DinB family protein n=1 Tax=Kitasatospora sp. NPDC048365 TaxID=3364050 RepID=UPI0037225229